MGLIESLFIAGGMFIVVVAVIVFAVTLLGVLLPSEKKEQPKLKPLKHVKTNSRKDVVKEVKKKRRTKK